MSDWTLESWLAKKGTVLTEKEAITATALVPRNMLNFSFGQVSELWHLFIILITMFRPF